jgi:Spy/CpxP family protein refolding chaperone
MSYPEVVMKARLAVLSSLVLLAAPLAAQGGMGAGRGNPMAMLSVPTTELLTEQLALSAEQQPKVAALIAAYDSTTVTDRAAVAKLIEAGDMQAMRGDPSMARVREARTKFTTDLKAMLTAEQVAKYDELYPQRMGRRPGGN